MLFKGITFISGKKKVLIKFILDKGDSFEKNNHVIMSFVFIFKCHILCLLKVT